MQCKKNRKLIKANSSKNKHRRQNTFNSSQYSLIDQKNYISVCDLFKNELIRKKDPHSYFLAQGDKQPQKYKSQKVLQIANKKRKNKSQKKLIKENSYEKVPAYKSSFNSEIAFSVQQTKRQPKQFVDKNKSLAIKFNEQYSVESNNVLRINIKKEFKRKMEAAVKIQKVFRGYLTRKILLKHIELYKNQGKSQNQESEKLDLKQKIQLIGSDEMLEDGYLQQVSSDQSESEDQDEPVIYRHQQPIYSHQQISKFLEESEEEEELEDVYQNQCLFKIDEQKNQSRKSSLQSKHQPKNKLSRPNINELKEKQTLEETDKPNEEAQKQGFIVEQEQMKVTQQSDSQQHQTLYETINSNPIEVNFSKKKKIGIETNNNKEEDVQKLKQVQMRRWDEMIILVNSQIHRNKVNNKQMTQFMKTIVEISTKNKQLLKQTQNFEQNDCLSHHLRTEEFIHFPSPQVHLKPCQQDFNSPKSVKNTLIQELKEMGNFQNQKDLHCIFDKKHVYKKHKKLFENNQKALFIDQVEISKSDEESQINQKKQKIENSNNSFKDTIEIKSFLMKNMHDSRVEQMLNLRQQLLQKRQCEELVKLNKQMINKQLTQNEFIMKLESLTMRFSTEKKVIDQTKDEIQKGHQAALNLVKEALHDAKQLGIKLPVSRSLESFHFKNSHIFQDIIVDQIKNFNGLNQFKNINVSNDKRSKQCQKISKNIESVENQNPSDEGLFSENSSIQIDFGQDQLLRLRKNQPYDMQIADLNKNMMIGQDFMNSQKNAFQGEKIYRQVYEIEQSNFKNQHNNVEIEVLTERQLQSLIWQLAGQIFIRPTLSQKFIPPNNNFVPLLISSEQKINFINAIEENLPTIADILDKLNQKICPQPIELLHCMRIDFNDINQSEISETDSNSYQQISKYQFIIPQQVCINTIEKFKPFVQKQKNFTQINILLQNLVSDGFNIDAKVIKSVNQRDKFIAHKLQHTKDLRWEVMNIELHCLFDAFNQQLIQIRSKKMGFSGIGLNQLTLSLIDNNKNINIDAVMGIIYQAKLKLLQLIIEDKTAKTKIWSNIKNEIEQYTNKQSLWILYAEQALSFALELVYMVEQQLFLQVAKQFQNKYLI